MDPRRNKTNNTRQPPTSPEHARVPLGTVVWTIGSACCTCIHVASDHIEILVTVDGAVVHHRTFTLHHDASDFAIEKMHDYHKT